MDLRVRTCGRETGRPILEPECSSTSRHPPDFRHHTSHSGRPWQRPAQSGAILLGIVVTLQGRGTRKASSVPATSISARRGRRETSRRYQSSKLKRWSQVMLRQTLEGLQARSLGCGQMRPPAKLSITSEHRVLEPEIEVEIHAARPPPVRSHDGRILGRTGGNSRRNSF